MSTGGLTMREFVMRLTREEFELLACAAAGARTRPEAFAARIITDRLHELARDLGRDLKQDAPRLH